MQSNKRPRRIISGFAMVIGFLFLCGCHKSQRSENHTALVVVSYGGGAWQESHKTAFFEPFTEITGNPIQSIVWNAEYGKLKTDVDAKNIKWDVVEVTAAQFVRGKRDNLYDEISVPLNANEFVRGAIDSNGIANVYWSTVLAYLPDQFQGTRPSSWSDFWNTTQYPGSRAMYDDPRGNLEFALLADGVDPTNLYPLDIDRAFASLDKIRPFIKVWWNDGSQPIQLLESKQVALSSGWNGRIFAAKKAGSKVEWSWKGAAHDLDYWVIPRGSKNKETGQRFLWFASQAYTMAVQTRMVGYGPANIQSLDFVSEDIRKQLPTNPTNFNQGFLIDSKWWGDNESAVMRRWIEWKSK